MMKGGGKGVSGPPLSWFFYFYCNIYKILIKLRKFYIDLTIFEYRLTWVRLKFIIVRLKQIQTEFKLVRNVIEMSLTE